MTKYRTVSNGHWDYLEYEEYFKEWFFITSLRWVRVPRPYYDKWYGRQKGYEDLHGPELYVTSLHTNLQSFIAINPDISKYLEWYNKEQRRLIDKAQDERAIIENKKGVVKYLN